MRRAVSSLAVVVLVVATLQWMTRREESLEGGAGTPQIGHKLRDDSVEVSNSPRQNIAEKDQHFRFGQLAVEHRDVGFGRPGQGPGQVCGVRLRTEVGDTQVLYKGKAVSRTSTGCHTSRRCRTSSRARPRTGSASGSTRPVSACTCRRQNGR